MLETINHILFWFGIFWIIVYAYFVFVNKGIPNIRTAPAIRKKVIELIAADFAARGLNSYGVVDVGSGNGMFTREIAKAIPQAKVIGVEISGQSVTWSNWQKRRQNLTNLEYRQMDFLNYDFAEANAVVMYLIPGILTTLGKKLHAEARPGTLIISNKFPLGDGWQPIETLHIKTLYLHQGAVYLYRKP